MTIIYFIISLGILVFIHELGHFLAAKRQGIGVEIFSLGFGPKIFGFKKGETTYILSALPLGGYVKLVGEDPDSAPEATEGGEQKVDTKKFYSLRPLWQKIQVVLAGPMMNLLLALLLMPLVFMLGRMEPAYLDQKPVVIGVKGNSPASQAGLKIGDEITALQGKPLQDWREFLDYIVLHGNQEVSLKVRDSKGTETEKVLKIEESPETHAGSVGVEPGYFIGNEAVVDEVAPGSPAELAGLQPGDRLLQMDSVPVNSWTEMSERVTLGSGKKIKMLIKRGDANLILTVAPRYDNGMNKWVMGVQKNMDTQKQGFIKKNYSLGEALVSGTKENLKLTGMTFSVVKRLLTLELSYKSLGGPIRIAQVSAMAAKSGLSDFLYFLAFLSLQLGIMNLLPIPALDGGHLLFFTIEGIIRRPLSTRARGMIEQFGFFALLFLMLLVTLNDVDRVWGFRQLFEKVRHLF